jgi:hypothetical protein
VAARAPARQPHPAPEPGTDPPAATAPPAAAPGEPISDDEAFAALIARWDEAPADRHWPAAEDLTEPRRPRRAGRPGLPPPVGPADLGGVIAPGAPGVPRRSGPPGPSGLPDVSAFPGPEPAADTPDGAADDRPRDGAQPPAGGADLAAAPANRFVSDAQGNAEDDNHYIPPPAPPAPRMRPMTRLALGSIALGVAILVVPTLLHRATTATREVTGVLLILSGVGVLVARMSDRPPTDLDDGPDDNGAVL